MILIVTNLIRYEQINQDGGSHGHGQTGYVDESSELVPEDTSQCDFQIVFNHKMVCLHGTTSFKLMVAERQSKLDGVALQYH
jgi:hypothetical protein